MTRSSTVLPLLVPQGLPCFSCLTILISSVISSQSLYLLVVSASSHCLNFSCCSKLAISSSKARILLFLTSELILVLGRVHGSLESGLPSNFLDRDFPFLNSYPLCATFSLALSSSSCRRPLATKLGRVSATSSLILFFSDSC